MDWKDLSNIGSLLSPAIYEFNSTRKFKVHTTLLGLLTRIEEVLETVDLRDTLKAFRSIL